MTPAELLTSRAELLLGEADRTGKVISFHLLAEIAGKSLPEISQEDRRAAVDQALRIANKREDAEMPVARREAAVTGNAPTPAGMMTPEQLREITLQIVKRDPKAKASPIWAEILKIGKPRCTFETFQQAYLVNARKALRNGGPPKAIAKPAPPPPVRVPSVAVTAPPPVALQPEPAKVIAPTTAPDARVEVSTRPGIVEIAGGGDAFRATRREDGGWDVELRAQVDDALMGQLAALLWSRVVGRAEMVA